MLQGMNILYENNSLVHYYFPIVQWGTGASGKNNLPISFNNILCALAVPNSPLYTYETSITSINKSYINIMIWSNNHGSSTAYYIAIGN